MDQDTSRGIQIALAAAVMLVAGFTASLYVFVCAMLAYLLFVTIYLGIRSGKGVGPFKLPLIITYALTATGYVLALNSVDVTHKYVLGFTPSTSATIYLIWITPFILNIVYGMKFEFLLSPKELEEYHKEIEGGTQ